jgi:hypothetical protein
MLVQLDDATIEDKVLVQFVKETLAAYKAPKHIVRVDLLKRQANGKSNYRWATSTAIEALDL